MQMLRGSMVLLPQTSVFEHGELDVKKNLPACERCMNLDPGNLGQYPLVARRALRLPLARHSSDLDCK